MMNQDRSTSPSLHRRNRWTILLLVMLLISQPLFLQPRQALAIGGFTITATTPVTNAQNIAFGTVITLSFNIDLNTATATNSTIVINGSMSGVVSATFAYDSGTRTLTLTPSRVFKAGEVVSVNATSGVKSSSAASLTPYAFQFTPGLQNNRCVDGFSSSGASLPGISDGAVTWGDYNNDGYADLALVGNSSSGMIAKIYRSNGDGSFTDSGAALPGLQYAAAAWGDYNNDGLLDLVISGQGNSGATTKLYKNTGSGFVDSGISLQGLFWGGLAWGDYDGDGYLDLVLSGYNGGSGTTILYHNNAGISLSNSGQALTGLLFSAAAWGDYNSDGALDLVMTGVNAGNNRVTLVYQNDGNGTLNDNGLPLTGIAQGNPAWGDYNSDGKLDLLITGSSGNGGGVLTMKLYRNDGGNSFTELTGTGLPPMNSGTAAWGDYDNDGKPDILVAGDTASSAKLARVYHNNGDGSFTDINAGLPSLSTGTAGTGAAAWGDYDKDGNLDLVLIGQNPNSPYNLVTGVYHNDACAPNLGIAKTVTPALATRGQAVSYTLTYKNSGSMAASSVLITDTIPSQLTGVSYQSSPALTTIGGSPYVWNVGSMPIGASGIITVSGTLNASVALGTIFTNTATIKGSPTDIHPSNDSASASALAAVLVASTTPAANASGAATSATINATFNEAMNSGTIDASTMSAYGSMTGLLPGAFGYNAATKKITFTPTNPYKSGEVVTVDMTAGIKDSTGSSLTPKLWQFVAGPVINNRCAGSFSDIGAGLQGVYNGATAWADYDKDGKLDLVLTGADSGSTPTTRLYRNTGSGFSVVAAGLPDLQYSTAAWADYDKDGDPDLMLSGFDASYNYTAKIYRNNGNGSFTDIAAGLTGVVFGAAAWGDYNDDGYLDLLLSGSNGSPTAYIYRNNAGASFTKLDVGITAYNESAVSWADYDSDGDLDILYTGRNDSTNQGSTRIYRNDGNDAFTNIDAGLTGVRAGSSAWGDYNQDGRPDLLLIGSTSGSSYAPISKIYRNNGGGSFTDIGAGLPGVLSGSASWVDYDNDGRLDAFVVGATSTGNTSAAYLYRNSGNGAFSDSGIAMPSAASSSAAWGDYNNDGDMDLLLVGQGAGFAITSKIYSNNNCVADLKIVKSAPATAARGQQLAYTINYSNIGQLTSTNIVITDTVPAQLTGVNFQSTRTITPTGTYVWQAGSLAPGASGVITITGTINPTTALDSIITNVASLSGLPAETATSDNSSTVTTQIKAEVIAASPVNHAFGAPLTSPINATFSDAMSSGSLSNATVKLQTSTTGLVGGSLSYNAGTQQMTLTPSRALKAGEVARVTLTSGVQTSAGAALLPYQWEFTAGPVVANRCVGRFFDIGSGMTGGYYSSAAWGDYDKDGNLDVLISGQDSNFTNFTKLYRNTGSGFSLVAGTGLPTVYLASLSWGDYNNDGYPDLLITGYDNNFGPISRVYRNNGNGSFTDIAAGLNGVYYGQGAWGDYDNDGYLDLVVAGNGYTTLYHGNGTTFSDANAGLPGVWGGAVAWGDYNNDGYLDLALSGSTTNSDASGAATRIYKNASGSFSNSGTVMTGVWYGSLAWGDYDQDGWLDLVSSGQTSVSSINSTKLYHNTAGGFVDSGVSLPGVYLGTVAWGDYNNDAKPDLLVTGDNANNAFTALYRNTGSSLTASGLSLPAFKSGGAAWGDYNNDGALDLIQVGYNSSFTPSASIYRNESCAAELSISKTTSQPVAGHGQTVQYLLNYSNTGTSAASNVVITDTVPAQLTGVSFQSSRTITPTGTYVWQIGTLAIGASGTITVTGQVDAGVAAGTVFTNTANISIAPGEVVTSNNSSSAATRVAFTISSTSPQANAFPVALNAPITLTFSDDANASTLSSASVILYGSLSGVINGTLNYNAGTRTLTLTPAAAFKPGETIRVRATSAVMSSAGVVLQPYQWEFTAGATGANCLDSISPISVGLPNIAADDAVWGDYDKDGKLDLLMIGGSSGKVYHNNGNGTFTDIGAGLPNATASAAAWGDYDNDGYLDFVISGNAAGAFTRLYHNNGNGSFTNLGNRGLASLYISTLAWGDYDNDGYLDLAFTGANINTGTKFTKLYHNNGNGAFSDSGISLTNVAGGPLSWADYDNDGNLDLLLTGQDNSNASITTLYHNNGNRTFSQVIGAGLPVVSSGAAAWGDYNGDGNLDLALSGYMGSSPASRIYRNNGNGTFSDTNAGLPAAWGSAVVWGDYNNDGKLDLALSGETSVSTPPYAPITRIYENHSGSFSDSGFSFTGLFNTALAWADENGDGFLDLLTAGFYDGSYTPLTKLYRTLPCQADLGITKSVTPAQATPGQAIVYTLTYSNAGTLPANSVVITDIVPAEVTGATFESSPAVPTIGGDTYSWQVGALAPGASGVITITGQVNPNLSFSSMITNTATIHTTSFESNQANNSSTVLSRVTFHIVSTDPSTNAQVVALAAPISAMFNADLNPSTINSSTIMLRGSTSGVIPATQSYDTATRTLTLTPARSFKAGEVIRVSATSGIQSTLGTSLQSYQWEFTAGITENRCLGSVTDTGSLLPPLANSTAAWGDYDGDGKLDLLLSGTLPSSAAVTRIYRNNGDGSFSTVSAGLPGVTGGAAAWGDYDNDGKLDLVLIGSSASGPIAKIYHNTGGSFADSGVVLPGLYSAAAAWGDYDNDGYLDLVLSGQDSSNSAVFTKLYHNDGNGAFSTVSAGFVNVYSAALAWGDYNNDGSLDLLVAGNTASSGSAGVAKLYKNNGNGAFSDSGVALAGLYSGAAAWGDYDGDGNLDLALSGSNSAYGPVTKLYHNNGAGALSDSGVALSNLRGSAAAWGDYDNDGRLDLVLSGSDASNTPITKLYRNNGGGSFSSAIGGLPQAFSGALAWGDYNGDNRLELAIFGYKNNAEYVGSLYRTNDCADLGIKKSVTPAQIAPGQPITYTLVYSNTGAGIANGVLITDTLPAQLTNPSYISSGPALTTIGSTPYAWSAGNLAPGASGMITVTGIASPTLSADQSFLNTASISASSGETSYANNSSGATVSVVAPRMHFSGSSYQVGEGGGSATITITLDIANPNTAVTVVYATTNGTATAGSDYTAQTGTLSIPAGQTSATFTIPISNDALSEPAETIILSLSQPSGAALASPASATLSIIDDDVSKIYLPFLRQN